MNRREPAGEFPWVDKPSSAPAPGLRRVLGVRDLVVYGLVLIQPIAPVGIFGLSSQMSRGHVSTTILLAMVAMSLTAFSYGRMAALYPSAGSAYTYVGRAFGAHLGFCAGWAMFLDYLVIPLLNVVFCGLTLARLVPAVPYAVWAILTAVVATLLNLRGVRATARANTILLAVMCVVIAAFVILAARFIGSAHGWPALFTTRPFYNPATFEWSAVASATSLAALTYIGFDGVTTLAEEVENPRRSVPLATVLTCLLTGGFSLVEVYLADLAWPDYTTFPNAETAFMDVTQRVGGAALFQAMGVVLILACVGSGMSGQAGLARLLYRMGRDGTLPGRFFGYVSASRGIPTWNILGCGVLTLGGALVLPYQYAAELLNFGAFLAFIGVNLAVVRQCWFRRASGEPRRLVADLLAPVLGFLFCLVIWLNLSNVAKIAGGGWLVLGLVYLAWRTRGFRAPVAPLNLEESANVTGETPT